MNLFVLASVLLGLASSDESLKPILLTSDTFERHLSSSPGTFVMYYAPWCGHCKKMYPVWEQLASRHQATNKYSIARIDCTKETELCSQHDILSYPTFIFYKKHVTNGDRYDGVRDLESLEAFMYEQLRRDRSNIDEPVEIKLEILNGENFDEKIRDGYYFIEFFAPWCSHCKNLLPTWKSLAKKYHGSSSIKIAQVDCTSSEKLCEKHNVNGYPTLLLFYNGKLVHNYEDGRTFDDLTNFIDDMIREDNDQAKEVKETLMKSGEVLELNEGTFESILKESSVLFIKFYAPWCGHCQRLEPTWKQLASRFAQQEDVLVARVDCTQNQELCQTLGINAYPKLILFLNGKRHKDYFGSRELENLFNFVIKNLKNDEL